MQMSYSLISAFIAGHHTAMALRSDAVQQSPMEEPLSLPEVEGLASLVSAWLPQDDEVKSRMMEEPLSLIVLSQDDEVMQVSLQADVPIHQAFADQGLDVLRVRLAGEQLDIKKTLADNGVEEGASLRIQRIEGIRDQLIKLATQSMFPSWTGHKCHPNVMRQMPSVDLLGQAVLFGDHAGAIVKDLINAGAPTDGVSMLGLGKKRPSPYEHLLTPHFRQHKPR